MVHWDRKKYRRILLLQIIFLLGLASALTLLLHRDEAQVETDESPFVVDARLQVPMKEISGAAFTPRSQGQEIVLVGDRKAELYHSDIASSRPGQISSFRSLILDRFSLCRSSDFDDCDKAIKKLSSNWEALRIDGKHRYFILQEHTQSVFVFDEKLSRIEKVLHFNFAAAFPEFIAHGSKKFRRNALGEGLILLKNGHILVAKEQYPLALVEFGPAGHKPLGIHPKAFLQPNEAFALPRTKALQVDLQPLAHWLLSGHSKCDISDIDRDLDGSLLMLSQSCQHIGRLPRLLPGRAAGPITYQALPRDIKNPEALTVLPDGRYLIGSDLSKKKAQNIFILRRPEPTPKPARPLASRPRS